MHTGLRANTSRARRRRVTSAGCTANTPHARFYVVQPGDNLTSIAQKTGLPVTTLEALNANLDPNSLQAGQRLRLRR